MSAAKRLGVSRCHHELSVVLLPASCPHSLRATPSALTIASAPRFQSESTSTKAIPEVTAVYIQAYHYENLAPTLFSHTVSGWGLKPAPCSVKICVHGPYINHVNVDVII